MPGAGAGNKRAAAQHAVEVVAAPIGLCVRGHAGAVEDEYVRAQKLKLATPNNNVSIAESLFVIDEAKLQDGERGVAAATAESVQAVYGATASSMVGDAGAAAAAAGSAALPAYDDADVAAAAAAQEEDPIVAEEFRDLGTCTIPFLSDPNDVDAATAKAFVPIWKRLKNETPSPGHHWERRLDSMLRQFLVEVALDAENKELAKANRSKLFGQVDVALTHVSLTGGSFVVKPKYKKLFLEMRAKLLSAGGYDFTVARPSYPLFRFFLDLDILQIGVVEPKRVALIAAIANRALRRLFAGRARARAAAALAGAVQRGELTEEDAVAALEDAAYVAQFDDLRTFLRCYVSVAPYKAEHKDGHDLIKSGAHLNWPHVIVDAAMAQQIRESILADLNLLLRARAPPANSWEEVLDHSVLPKVGKQGGGLRMVGAHKAGKCPDRERVPEGSVDEHGQPILVDAAEYGHDVVVRQGDGSLRTYRGGCGGAWFDHKFSKAGTPQPPLCDMCGNSGRVQLGRPYRPLCVIDGGARPKRDLAHEAYVLQESVYAWLVLTDIQTDATELPDAYGYEVPPDEPRPLESLAEEAHRRKRDAAKRAKAAARARGEAGGGGGSGGAGSAAAADGDPEDDADAVALNGVGRPDNCSIEVLRGEELWVATDEFIRAAVSPFFGGVYDRVTLTHLKHNKSRERFMAWVSGRNARFCHNLEPLPPPHEPPPRGVGRCHKNNNIVFEFTTAGRSWGCVHQRCFDSSGVPGVSGKPCSAYQTNSLNLTVEMDKLMFGSLPSRQRMARSGVVGGMGTVNSIIPSSVPLGGGGDGGGGGPSDTDEPHAGGGVGGGGSDGGGGDHDDGGGGSGGAPARKRRRTAAERGGHADDEAAAAFDPNYYRELYAMGLSNNALLSTTDSVCAELGYRPLSMLQYDMSLSADGGGDADERRMLTALVAYTTQVEGGRAAACGMVVRQSTRRIDPLSLGLGEEDVAAELGWTIRSADPLESRARAELRRMREQHEESGGSRTTLPTLSSGIVADIITHVEDICYAAAELHPDDVRAMVERGRGDLVATHGRLECRSVLQAHAGPPGLPPLAAAALAEADAAPRTPTTRSPARRGNRGAAEDSIADAVDSVAAAVHSAVGSGGAARGGGGVDDFAALLGSLE